MFRPERLVEWRKKRKLTQEQLAMKVKTTKGTISNYENSHSTPPHETLVAIADVLGISTDYLLGRTDDPTPTPSKFTVAGKTIELTPEEAIVFEEMRKDPRFNVMFHDLAKNPEKKVKMLIKMWETIKASLDEDEDDLEEKRKNGFGNIKD